MQKPNLPAIRALRPAWNKDRIVGQKRPVKPKHVWAIRVRLELAENHRDLALFNMAIDCKLRGCDLCRMQILASANGTLDLTGGIAAIYSSTDIDGVTGESTRARIDIGMVHENGNGVSTRLSAFADGLGDDTFESFGAEAIIEFKF